MPTLGDPRNQGTTTLVGFHDLLGFGDLLASSGGTLDSAVGQIARERIVGLRRSLSAVRSEFPAGTEFFHFNDTVTAFLDVDIEIRSSHTDPSGIGAIPVSRESQLVVLRFVSACAALHQQTVGLEEEERLGPAGRTFVVLGKRWEDEDAGDATALEIRSLQANLAFAEAYLADDLGSAAGFDHRSYYRVYLNDHVWFVLSTSQLSLSAVEQSALAGLGLKNRGFPVSLMPQDVDPVGVRIFHRKRTFYPVMSHHACDIAARLDASA